MVLQIILLMSQGLISGIKYVKASFIDFDVVEQVLWEILEDEEYFAFFLESFLDVDDVLPLKHFKHSDFPLYVLAREFILIAILEFLDGN